MAKSSCESIPSPDTGTGRLTRRAAPGVTGWSRRRNARGAGEEGADRRALARRALRPHAAAVGLYQMLHDGETQTGAPHLARAARVHSVESLEDSRQVLEW